MPEASSGRKPAFGLYVHWPFCLAKCPYCDFNSHVRSGSIDTRAFGRHLVRELEHFAGRTPGRKLSSIFFGGGTPSLMPPSVVAGVIDAAVRHWATDPGIEITLEANPTSAEAEYFRGYRSAGVNRVSLGVQALDDADLHFLGRQHSSAEALSAFAMASRIFPRTSFDLIYARPGQTATAWQTELQRALKVQTGHMSLYQLTIEPGTTFARLHATGKLVIPDDVVAVDLYELTQELTSASGLDCYEVSNHATPGHECRHNLIYWGYGEYAGIGPGAHSRLIDESTRVAVQTHKSPEIWNTQVAERGDGIFEETRLTPHEAGEEYILMGLRHSGGIDPSTYTALSSRTLCPNTLADLVANGMLKRDRNDRIRTTASGRHVLNAITRELLA